MKYSILAFSLLLGSSPAQSWHFEPAPAPGTETNVLYGVDGVASNDVWSVGYQKRIYTQSQITTLTLRWNGSAWTHVASPNPNPPQVARSAYNVLSGVAVPANGRAVAVGTYTSVGSKHLAMEWNGSSWSVLSSPTSRGGNFYAVTCSPSQEIWAAGDLATTTGGAFPAMIAKRSGGGWTMVEAPAAAPRFNRFYGVSALPNGTVFAVGTKLPDRGQFHILMQRYDGSSWTTYQEPTPGGLDTLQDVVAFSETDVWAAGYWYPVSLGRTQPLIMHFDGSAWTKVQLPTYAGSCELRSMTARGPNDIYAAGTKNQGGVQTSFMLHYDGAAWSEVALPPAGRGYEWFRGMSTTPEGELWAVGQYFSGENTAPLTMNMRAGFAAYGSGPLTLSGNGAPQGGGPSFDLRTTGAAAGAFGVHFFSLQAANVPLPGGLELLVGLTPSLSAGFLFDASGAGTLSLALPRRIPAVDVFTQSFAASPSAPLMHSNGLRMILTR